ncbi:unnamed protein product [Adineta steineri]|uniref:Uncharacterized protein n=1 Tax=Adineta steineri TaxID=433720 RepID=A0A818TI05_9BILA|nr:unnamed protein product [Adineta steineri]
MIYTLDNSILLLLSSIIFIVQSTTIYQNDYEPRVFDHIPSNCYDCLSYRDIILTQLTDVPKGSFKNFNLGSRDTYMILNAQLKLKLDPYAFQSLVIQKPNHTLTITLAAPNSWLNITENTFNGLEIHSYSTLRIIIKYFYGVTFHKNSLSGIKMDKYSHLIIDISSVTEIYFENNVIKENDFNSSVEFLISRTDTIQFDSNSFSQLIIKSHQIISFHFELISHIYFKSHSFQSLQLQTSSSVRFYSIFLNRLTIDTYAFDNMLLDSHSIFNFTIRTLGTCLCFKSYSFNNIHSRYSSENILILFQFHTLRGLSFFSNTFSNLSLNNLQNQLKILSSNPLNDPNPIINFATDTFSTIHTGSILLNFSEVIIIKFEKNSLKTNYLHHKIFMKSISLVDLSTLNYTSIKTKFLLYFDNIHYVKWYKHMNEEKNFNRRHSLIQYHFNYLTNSSCLIYSASRFIPWLFSSTNSTICNCPLFYAYKHGQLDGQLIPCLHSMSGRETAEKMNECDFNRIEKNCHSTLQSLTDLTTTNETPSIIFNSFELDNLLIRQLYDKNYLTCSFNYSSLSSTMIIRSRLFNNFGIVIGIILGIFIILLILVMALLNGLQYKMREYDESWTWRRNMSWTTLRRTLSQTSLRRSRRDLRTINSHGITSKSDNQLDRLRYDQQDIDDRELNYDFKQSQSIQEDLKRMNRI